MDKIYQNPLLNRTPVKCGFGGFTLIELLVVVLIIGILAAVAVPQYRRTIRKTQMAQVFVWLDGLKKAQENYYMANAVYASRMDETGWQFPCKRHVLDDGGAQYPGDKCYFDKGALGIEGFFRLGPTQVSAGLFPTGEEYRIHCYRGLNNAPPGEVWFRAHPSAVVCSVGIEDNEGASLLQSMGGVFVGDTNAAICSDGPPCLEYRM